MVGKFYFFVRTWRNMFQFSSIPTEYKHAPYKRRVKHCLKGWSLVRPSLSVQDMHHCMSMTTIEQGILGLEAKKASYVDDFGKERQIMLCAKRSGGGGGAAR